MRLLAFIPLPPPPLLGTTGTELLQFGLLVAAGVWIARRAGAAAGRFVVTAFAAVSLFYLLCPEQSGFQRVAGRAAMETMATLQAGLMRLGGAAVSAEGTAVVGTFRFSYVNGCMGLSYLAMALLCLGVQPAGVARRLAGLAVMSLGMISLNLARLIVLYGLWASGHMSTYKAFHDVGGVFFAMSAFGLYFAVFRLRTSPIPTPSPSAALAPSWM